MMLQIYLFECNNNNIEVGSTQIKTYQVKRSFTICIDEGKTLAFLFCLKLPLKSQDTTNKWIIDMTKERRTNKKCLVFAINLQNFGHE